MRLTFLTLAFNLEIFGSEAEKVRTAKEIMGDEQQEVILLEDGSTIKGYSVLNRVPNIFYNCDAGGFYSLEQGGFIGENVKIDGYEQNGDLVLKAAKIAPTAKVYGHAQLSGWARIHGHAQVFGHAQVSGWSTVTDNAKVYGSSKVYGWSWVSGSSQVLDDAQVFGQARLSGHTKIGASAKVYQQGRVSGEARINGLSRIHGKTWVDGNAYVTGRSNIYGQSRVSQNAKIADSVVTGWVRIYGNAHVYGKMLNGRHLLE